MKLLLGYTYDAGSTADFTERSLRRAHDVRAFGRSTGRPQDLPTDRVVDLPALVERARRSGFIPEAIVLLEGMEMLLPLLREAVPLPIAAYLFDNHIKHRMHRQYLAIADLAFTSKRVSQPLLASPWAPPLVWLPHACEPRVHAGPEEPRTIDIGFIGTVNPRQNRFRSRLLTAVGQEGRLEVVSGEYRDDLFRLYRRSRIVINQSIRNDLNMRLFEGMAAGALVITNWITDGLTDLFTEDREVVIYEGVNEAAAKVRYYLAHEPERARIATAGRDRVLAEHTYDVRTAVMTQELQRLVANGPRPWTPERQRAAARAAWLLGEPNAARRYAPGLAVTRMPIAIQRSWRNFRRKNGTLWDLLRQTTITRRPRPWTPIVSFLTSQDPFLHRSVLLFIGAFTAAILTFLLNFSLARFLGPEAFGNVKTVWSFALLALGLVEVGVSTTVIRYVALYRGGGNDPAARHLIARLLRFRILTAAVVVPLLLLLRVPLARELLGDAGKAFLLIPGALYVAFGLLELARPVATGFESFGLLAGANVLIGFGYLAFGLPLALWFGAPGALYGIAIAIPFGTAFAFRRLWRFLRAGPSQAAESVRALLTRFALPLQIANAPTLLVGATIPILSLAFPQRAIGYYAFAFTFATAVTLLAGTIGQVVVPGVAADLGRRDPAAAVRRFRRALSAYLGISVLGILLTVLLGPSLLSLLAASYRSGFSLTVALVTFAFPHAALALTAGYWSARGHLGRVAWIQSLAGLSWVAVSFALLAHYAPRL